MIYSILHSIKYMTKTSEIKISFPFGELVLMKIYTFYTKLTYLRTIIYLPQTPLSIRFSFSYSNKTFIHSITWFWMNLNANVSGASCFNHKHFFAADHSSKDANLSIGQYSSDGSCIMLSKNFWKLVKYAMCLFMAKITFVVPWEIQSLYQGKSILCAR